jgi:hypothetical protein
LPLREHVDLASSLCVLNSYRRHRLRWNWGGPTRECARFEIGSVPCCSYIILPLHPSPLVPLRVRLDLIASPINLWSYRMLRAYLYTRPAIETRQPFHLVSDEIMELPVALSVPLYSSCHREKTAISSRLRQTCGATKCFGRISILVLPSREDNHLISPRTITRI